MATMEDGSNVPQPVDQAAPMPANSKMAYSPSELPPPINGYEQYVRANLIEARLLRMAVQELSATIKEYLQGSNEPEKKAPAKK